MILIGRVLLQLEFIKEIGFTHMRILEGVSTVIQLGGLMARLCQLVSAAHTLRREVIEFNILS